MTTIIEGAIQFEFADEWAVLKFDEETAYTNWIEKLDETKAIDILGLHENTVLYLIEIKDFRGHRIQNERRLISGELAIEVGQKVKDSVACIIGAGRNPSHAEKWSTYKQALCDDRVSLCVILWLEFDPPYHRSKRKKVNASVESNQLKKKLRWLTSRVFVTNVKNHQDSPFIPDFTATFI